MNILVFYSTKMTLFFALNSDYICDGGSSGPPVLKNSVIKTVAGWL